MHISSIYVEFLIGSPTYLKQIFELTKNCTTKLRMHVIIYIPTSSLKYTYYLHYKKIIKQKLILKTKIINY